MKTARFKLKHALPIALVMFLLPACTANFITDIQSDGSGLFTQEYIMSIDELTSYGYTVGEDVCTEEMGMDLSEMPPGTILRQEESEEDITCIFETSFASMDELQTIYGDYLDSIVNDLRIENNKVYYDVTLDLGEENILEMGFLASWIVKFPGTVSEHNADTQQGNTLTWDMTSGGLLNIRAVSDAGVGSSTVWWVVGIVSFCLCLIVLAAVITLIVVLMRRNKKKGESQPAG